ncbi:uncharacterized protein K441DRAFT_631386 [Cenococcum geophilum 1.58]|uniref:uncharacterized protein n=1 Tax=Cenococcum geophilum 1.58 TaxID=794803 RepID=UPI00358EC111
MIHSSVLLREEVTQLRRANEAASRRKKRTKKRIQKRGVLTKAEGSEILAQADVDAQLQGEDREGRQRARGDVPHQRHCRRYGKAGHNSGTCK